MIKSFGDQETEKIFHQIRSKKIPPKIQDKALVKLLMIDAAVSENDFRIPPSNNFEHLKGKRSGFCSIRINVQWRIVFRFYGGESHDVAIVDYH